MTNKKDKFYYNYMILSKFQFQSKTQDKDVNNNILVLKTAAFKNDLSRCEQLQ